MRNDVFGGIFRGRLTSSLAFLTYEHVRCGRSLRGHSSPKAPPKTTYLEACELVWFVMNRDDATVRPLLVRPGARFTCHGDGLCCTHIHVLGPLNRSEVTQLRVLQPSSIDFNAELSVHAFATTSKGHCVHLRPSLRCGVHAKYGREAKPQGCRRFPYGLIATPMGGRITTEHRCPCRTLGERTPIDLSDAARSLTDAAGRLSAIARVGNTLPWRAQMRISFERYLELEATWMSRVMDGEQPEQAFGVRAFPTLRKSSWQNVVRRFENEHDETAFSYACLWFAAALRALAGEPWKTPQARPWAWAFDRAQLRSPKSEPQSRVLADWFCDVIWSMDWLHRISLERALSDYATRWCVAQELTRRLRRLDLRPDRAAAEAIMIVELAAASPVWESVSTKIQ